MTKIQMVSSPWTLTLKLLLPTFWFCLFGGTLIFLLVTPLANIGEPFTPTTARLMMVSWVLTSAVIYYLIFSPIKWVGMDTEKLYVSNFMKSFQYTYDSISKVEERRLLLWNKVTIHFHETGNFGKSISFFGTYYWHYYLKQHPEVLKVILNK